MSVPMWYFYSSHKITLVSYKLMISLVLHIKYLRKMFIHQTSWMVIIDKTDLVFVGIFFLGTMIGINDIIRIL
jgi:hypothetical protein